MKYNRIEVNAESYAVLYHSKRTNKVKAKAYSAYQEWLYNHAPICNEVMIVQQGTEEVYAAAIVEKWREELKAFFSSKCGKGVVVADVQIKSEIIKNKPCASFSVKECLEMMTPEQFFSEFGQIAIDSIRKI